MPLPELMIAPMRRELAERGLLELRSAEDVDAALRDAPGTVLIAVNSACGCSATRMRPAVVEALRGPVVPDRAFTVFAGQDLEATARARDYFTGHPPSSPSVALLRDGRLVWMLGRDGIERRLPQEIAAELTAAFERHCV